MYETILSLAPALVLLAVILFIDRRKSEPFSEIILALLGGVVAVVLCLILGMFTQSYALNFNEGLGITPSFNSAFFGAGLPEELAKLLVLFLLVRRNKHFDERVDGIVYAALIGLGFAAYENVLYVVGSEDVEQTAAIRAILSVPAHFLFALFMGYWFSRRWWEKTHKFRNLAMALVIPVIIHTAFDFICFFLGQFEEISEVISIVTMVLLLSLNISGFIMARKLIRRQLNKDAIVEEKGEEALAAQEEAAATTQVANAVDTPKNEADTLETEATTAIEISIQETDDTAKEATTTETAESLEDTLAEEPTAEEAITVMKESVSTPILTAPILTEAKSDTMAEEQTVSDEEVSISTEEPNIHVEGSTFKEECAPVAEKPIHVVESLHLPVRTPEEEAALNAEAEAARERIRRRRAEKKKRNGKSRANIIWSRIYVIIMVVVACLALLYLVYAVIDIKDEKKNRTVVDPENIEQVVSDLGNDLVNRPDVIKSGAEEGKADYMCYTACIYWSHETANDSIIAQEWIDKALEETDKLFVAESLNQAAYAYVSVNKQDFALRILDFAIKTDPTDANLYDSRGEMLWDLGKKQEAKQMWEKVMKLDPEFLDSHGETKLHQLLEENDMI